VGFGGRYNDRMRVVKLFSSRKYHKLLISSLVVRPFVFKFIGILFVPGTRASERVSDGVTETETGRDVTERVLVGRHRDASTRRPLPEQSDIDLAQHAPNSVFHLIARIHSTPHNTVNASQRAPW